jgi:tRNA(adenine34) deaminase
MKDFMKEAFKEAQKAYKKNEVPVGAVVVKNGKIIARGYNKKEKTNLATRHAEIIAIEKACKKLKNWHLEDCELYVTLEPCLMCCGAIIQSRIKKLYYGVKSDRFGYVESVDKLFNKNTHIMTEVRNLNDTESLKILQDFFKNKRK